MRTKNFGLSIRVSHPASETADIFRPYIPDRNAAQICDADGQFFSAIMLPMAGEQLVEVQIRRGVSASTAASIMRKIADRIEQNGETLLDLRAGTSGSFSCDDGHFVDDGRSEEHR